MATSFVDALMGYEYFLEKRGKVSLEEVNDYLDYMGRSPISPRTFTHYRSLLRHGFRSYVPINQFDVSRTLGQLQMAADRRRYLRENVKEIDSMVSQDGITWISAKIIDRSLVGFGMYTMDRLPFKSGTHIWIQIDNYHEIPATFIWKHSEGNRTRFGVRAFEFIAKYQIIKKEVAITRPTGIIIVKKFSKGDIFWGELYRILRKIDELMDASKSLLDSIAKIADIDIKLATPVLLSIKFSSPGEIQVKADLGIAEVIKLALQKAQLWKLEKDRYKAENRGKEIDNSLREIEALRNAVRLRKEAIDSGIAENIADSLFYSTIMKALNVSQLPSPLFERNSLESGILTDRLLPAAAELKAGDDPDIEIEVKENSSDESEKN